MPILGALAGGLAKKGMEKAMGGGKDKGGGAGGAGGAGGGEGGQDVAALVKKLLGGAQGAQA